MTMGRAIGMDAAAGAAADIGVGAMDAAAADAGVGARLFIQSVQVTVLLGGGGRDSRAGLWKITVLLGGRGSQPASTSTVVIFKKHVFV